MGLNTKFELYIGDSRKQRQDTKLIFKCHNIRIVLSNQYLVQDVSDVTCRGPPACCCEPSPRALVLPEYL